MRKAKEKSVLHPTPSQVQLLTSFTLSAPYLHAWTSCDVCVTYYIGTLATSTITCHNTFFSTLCIILPPHATSASPTTSGLRLCPLSSATPGLFATSTVLRYTRVSPHPSQMLQICETLTPTMSPLPSHSRGNKRPATSELMHFPPNESPPPYPTSYTSPRKRRLHSSTHEPLRHPSFHAGTSSCTPSACAICLGRHHHKVYKCNSITLWNGEKPHCHRNEQGCIINPNGSTICSDWQRPIGCASSGSGHHHECSGCGKGDHGAQECPRVQKE
jgi:hypothetical protein